MSDRARLTECSDAVWCDTVCGIHADHPDPYGYGEDEPCPGPHRKLYLFAKPSEGEF